MVLWGYARVWLLPDTDCPRTIGSTTARERFAPFAFTRWLSSGREIKALLEHDRELELASTADGSLTLWQDHVGLAFVMEPHGEFAGRVISDIRTGRLQYMSVGGLAFDDYVYERDPLSGEIYRTILESSVREVSIVARPAARHTLIRATEKLPLFMLSRRLDGLATEGMNAR
jgi:HK97 family phage prohead protease